MIETEWKINLEDIKQKAEWMDAEVYFKRSTIRVKIPRIEFYL